MNDNTFWVCLWAMLLTAVVTLGTITQYNYLRYVQHMAELGYQEETIVGCHVPVWRKVAEPAKPASIELPLVTSPEAQIVPL